MERLWKGVGTGSQEEKVVQEGGSYHEAQAADKASKMRMELIIGFSHVDMTWTGAVQVSWWV